MGSIPIARSINPADAVGLTDFRTESQPQKYPILDALGRETVCHFHFGRESLELQRLRLIEKQG